jgi:hypothetical protein
MGVIVWSARPDSLFVELNALVLHAAEDHGAEPSVTHRQSIRPQLRRLDVPEA